MKSRIAVALLVLGALVTTQAMADINVYFEPTPKYAGVGDTFTVDIVADIPEAEAVAGFGLDFSIADSGVASLVSGPGMPVIGSDFFSVFAPDGDGLAGLATLDQEVVYGDGVVLATMTLYGEAVGQTEIFASATPGDATEGFPIDPALGGGFASVNFTPGLVIIPEPASLALLALGGLALLRRR